MSRTAAVLGASGYAGAEVVRLLSDHPDLSVLVVTAETHAGRKLGGLYPHLSAAADLLLEPLERVRGDLDACDVVFCALPHGEAMQVLPDLRNDVVVDLGGDFRLDSADDYTSWYRVEHTARDDLAQWTYGLPEIFREDIRRADRIANPGCYPTAVVLAMAPFVAEGLVEGPIVADAASGTSGAGRSPKPGLHFSHVDEDVRAYKVAEHQHTPEMEMALSRYAGLSSGSTVVSFTAHLVPMARGIHATCSAHVVPGTTQAVCREVLAAAYADEPFVTVQDVPPGTKEVRGSNRVALSATVDERSRRVIVLSVLDNLVKGAAGQAIQNANLALGLPEVSGLPSEAIYP